MKNPKLLIIDDDKALCESLKDTLELEGYLVDLSYDAEDGIKKIEVGFYNIVLLDKKLPNSHGLVVLEKIKAISPDTEVIIFTAYAEMDTVIKAMDKDAFSFIPKPFETPYLVTILKRAREKQRIILENRILFQQTVEEEREWEETFDAISDLISIHDKDFNIIRCNKAVIKKLNTEYGDILGRKCYEVFHGRNEPWPTCPFARCKETLKPETEEEECMGGTFLMSCFPRFDESGKFNGVVHIARDITKRKRAENALQEKEKFFSSTLDDMLTLVGVLEPDGKVVFINNTALKLWDIKLEDVKGKMFYDTVWFHNLDKVRKKLQCSIELCASGEKVVHDIEYQIVDGTIRWAEYSIHPILDEDEKVKYLIPEGRDITERKKIEEKLRISYKMSSLGELTAGVFHEILNPLNIISSHIQLLLLEAGKGSKDEEDLKSVQEEITRIVKITDALLRFSRGGGLETEKVCINILLEKTLSIVAPDMKLDNIYFIRKFDNKIPLITANSDGLRQVFLNLITNARDAMPEGGTLTVKTLIVRSSEFRVKREREQRSRLICRLRINTLIVWSGKFGVRPPVVCPLGQVGQGGIRNE